MKVEKTQDLLNKYHNGYILLHFPSPLSVEEFREHFFENNRMVCNPHFVHLRDFNNDNEKENWIKELKENKIKFEVI